MTHSRWGNAQVCGCLGTAFPVSPYRAAPSFEEGGLPPGFCRRCRACAGPRHARTFAGRAFGGCDQHAWLAFVYVCLSLWRRGFVALALLILRVVVGVCGPPGLFVGLIVLADKVSLAVPFAVSGLAALCVVGICLHAALARRAGRRAHITCARSASTRPSAASTMSSPAVMPHRGAASPRWRWRWG